MVKVRNLFKESRLTFAVVVLLFMAVLGTVGGSIFSASSVNNLTKAVANDNIASEKTACRTAVQADYDATFSRIILGILADDEEVPAGLLQEEYEITPQVLINFERSVNELSALEQGLICTEENPTREMPED